MSGPLNEAESLGVGTSMKKLAFSLPSAVIWKVLVPPKVKIIRWLLLVLMSGTHCHAVQSVPEPLNVPKYCAVWLMVPHPLVTCDSARLKAPLAPDKRP